MRYGVHGSNDKRFLEEFVYPPIGASLYCPIGASLYCLSCNKVVKSSILSNLCVPKSSCQTYHENNKLPHKFENGSIVTVNGWTKSTKDHMEIWWYSYHMINANMIVIHNDDSHDLGPYFCEELCTALKRYKAVANEISHYLRWEKQMVETE